MTSQRVHIDYVNYRGERGRREIIPHRIEWSSSQWHPEPQWLLVAFDCQKNEMRSFAMKDIASWAPGDQHG